MHKEFLWGGAAVVCMCLCMHTHPSQWSARERERAATAQSTRGDRAGKPFGCSAGDTLFSLMCQLPVAMHIFIAVFGPDFVTMKRDRETSTQQMTGPSFMCV